jgi:hypothetical protein
MSESTERSPMRAPRIAFFAGVLAIASLLVLPEMGTAQTRDRPATGPCTSAAAASMPDGEGHDHLNIAQHRFACRATTAFFDPLVDELEAEQDVILGEVDVENDLLAIAVAFPESGVLFYDVSNPAEPVFQSWYRGSKCEEVVVDVDCGAYVDLSEDGKVAFLSLQDITGAPQSPPDPGVEPVTEPGVEVIDVRDPANPVLSQAYPMNVDGGGVHTSNSHVIPANPSDPGARAPGEYLFSVSNVDAIEITKVNRVAGLPLLTPFHTIEIDELHDMFLQNDPLTGRTYLYVAAGFASGFYVYDVTDPSQPELLAEWDPTPECAEDWYGHTTFTTVRNGRRFVTIDAEVFGGNGEFGEQSAEDQAEGCGRFVGNGDKVGPLWIVDATDFSELQPADALDGEETDGDAQALKAASEEALVATWTNPAGRAGGNIEFSPHNQTIVGDRIVLSHYHGGVYLLDASAAFRGRSVRPTELGFVVPSGEPVRPIHEALILDPLIPFIHTFFQARPTVWDAVFYKGHVLAADSTGGLYSFVFGRRTGR